MGCDLAVAFSEHEFSADDVARSLAALGTDATVVYLVLGRGDRRSAGRSYFALWSDERVDLPALCSTLSAHGRICISWKSEHGGVAGYVTFDQGQELANDSDSGDEYLRLPSQGVERAFGVRLDLTDEVQFAFPEILFDGSVACFSVEPRSGVTVAMPPGAVDQLLEEELDVDPVLPLDVR